jgi:hypothetical protein
MKIGPVPTGHPIFDIAFRAWKRIIPYTVYLIRPLRF